ncbi:MAG: helix-turn-helix domain-containing protein [Polyangiales bacterium]
MPWKATCVVDQRLLFIAAAVGDPRGNVAQLCRQFGISRAKGYKWLERYEAEGPAGLEDRKPIARSCPHRTPDDFDVEVRDRPRDPASNARMVVGDEYAVSLYERVTTLSAMHSRADRAP